MTSADGHNVHVHYFTGIVVLVDDEHMQVSDPEKEAKETSRGFEPRSLDSESRVLTVTPRGQL